MTEDKTMRAQDHILEKIHSERVIFSCYNYYYYFIIYYDIRYKVCSTLASYEDPVY